MKRTALAVALGLTVAGVVLASAASIGGVDTDLLGADVTAVASCDQDGVDVDYTTDFDAADSRYEVIAVRVSDIDAACDTAAIAVTLADASSSTEAEATGVVGATGAETLAVAGYPAESVERVAVVLDGGLGVA